MVRKAHRESGDHRESRDPKEKKEIPDKQERLVQKETKEKPDLPDLPEQTEKMEVYALAEKLDGDIEAAIRQLAERRRREREA